MRPTRAGYPTAFVYVDIRTDVPLKLGNNVITVFAREDEEFQSRRSLFVYRRGPAEVAAQQPAKSGAR